MHQAQRRRIRRLAPSHMDRADVDRGLRTEESRDRGERLSRSAARVVLDEHHERTRRLAVRRLLLQRRGDPARDDRKPAMEGSMRTQSVKARALAALLAVSFALVTLLLLRGVATASAPAGQYDFDALA